ncbi:MAG: histidine kinase [Chitinophagaceae bacterium]
MFTSGQQPSYKLIPPQYELEHLKLNNKDDIGIFNDITEDKQGYLWLNSNKGLHVFDGNHTITYKNGNGQYMLMADSVYGVLYAFANTGNANFWIQEENSRMMLFDPVKRKLVESFTNQATADELIFYTATSDEGILFISTVNRQKATMTIWRKTDADKPDSYRVVPIYQSAINLQSFYSYKIAGQYHWIFEEKRLTRVTLDGKQKERCDIAVSPNYSINSDDKNNFYFTDTKHEAIYTWNEQLKKTEVFLTLPAYLKGKGAYFYIKGNTVYLGDNLSLFIIDRQNNTIQDLSSHFIELAKKEAPNSLGVLFLKFFHRNDSSLLLCTQADIYRLKKKTPSPQQFLQKVDAVNNISPILSFRAIAEDDQKNIYASYYTGIAKKADGEKNYISLPVKKYISGELISTYSLHYWKNHLLWNNVSINLATGAYKYLTGSIFGGHCTQLLRHDTLWLFHWNSNKLYCYDLLKNKLTTYPIDSAVTKSVRLIGEMNDMTGDATGQNLWISTSNDGIALISKKGKLLKQYSSNELVISDNYVTDLELIGDNLWFGCKDGLGVLDIPTGKTIIYKNPATINNGVLQNRTVFTILPDTAGNFYLGSSYGLLWFNIAAREFYNLAEDHPMATIEFNRASAFKASDNRYYFGTTDGLCSFTAGELEFSRSSNLIQPVKLFAVSIFNNKQGAYHYLSKDLDSLNKLILQPFDNNIELSFAVPEFYKKIYYSYRVKGQNENWTEFKLDNKILLYGLQPGTYTLEAKASTGLNDANASYYSLLIEMKQVWYKKPWVIVLFSLLAITMIIGFLRFRFSQKIKRQKDLADLRTKISSDLHDDVGTILSGLAMQSQMLTYSAKEEQKESLNEISNMSRDAMEHMRDIVWAMDSRKDKFENLVDRIRAYAEKNLAMNDMTHEFVVENIDAKKFIDPEKRQAVYFIFKEAITNIIKHSDGKHVTIYVIEDKNKLSVKLCDNGSKKPASHSDGLGLSNMKMRAEKIGGTLNAKYDDGFVVELII